MRTKLFAAAVILLAVLVPAFGQTFGEISGEVRDTSGATIAGAQITIVNVDTNAVTRATAGPDGSYTLTALRPGTYNISTGTAAPQRVTIGVGETATLDIDTAAAPPPPPPDLPPSTAPPKSPRRAAPTADPSTPRPAAPPPPDPPAPARTQPRARR